MAKLKKVKETEESYKAPVSYGEYRGRPTIILSLVSGSTFKFTFGLTKAKLILEYLPEIKAFIEKYEK